MKVIHDADEEDWREFVSGNPNGNIFQTPEMARVYEKTQGCEPIRIFAVQNGEIQGVLLASLMWTGRQPLKSFSSRCILQGGPLCSEHKWTSNLLQELDRSVSRRALYTEVRNLWELESQIPVYESSGYTFAPHLNYHIDLCLGQDKIWSGMSKGRRKGISKAERIGLETVEVRSDSQFDDFFRILKKTYSDLGMPLADRSLFASTFRILVPLSRAKLLLCKHGGKSIACRGFLLFKKTIYDWYAGSLAEDRSKKADEYLVWDALRWGISQGYEVFDFGGAGSPEEEYGPREFKRRFGGRLIEPGRFKKVYKPTRLWIGGKAFQVFRRLK